MFTGIIRGCFPIVKIDEKPGLKTFYIDFPPEYLNDLQIGASVAINGACMTVTEIQKTVVLFDAMLETLQKTNLGGVKVGDGVNVERSAKMSDEIGGHLMSGHVMTTAEIVKIETPENNHVVTFQVAAGFMKYIFDKGFIGLDGASLTIVNPNKETGTFDVWLIPETLRLTAYANRKVGDRVNVEIDSRTQTIVDTVEQVLAQNK